MKLSTRTRYGMRAILELAENYGNGALRLKTIAKHQELSVKYLEQLMAILKSAGIVRSIRGPKGGYALVRSPSQIKISDCFVCLEGSVITTECAEDDKFCTRAEDCITRYIWAEMQKAVMGVLNSMTLQNLVDMAESPKDPDYQI